MQKVTRDRIGEELNKMLKGLSVLVFTILPFQRLKNRTGSNASHLTSRIASSLSTRV